MKKFLSILVTASMLACASVPAMAADAELVAAIQEGMSNANAIVGSTVITSSGEESTVSFYIEKDADGCWGNLSVEYEAGEQTISVDDAARVVDGTAYIHVGSVVEALGEDSEDLTSMLEALGITGEWIAFDAKEFKTDFTDAVFELVKTMNEDLNAEIWDSFEQEDNALYITWGNGEEDALQEKVTAVINANEEKYKGMLNDAMEKFDAEALLSNKYLTAVIDTLSMMSEDMNKDTIKAMLEGTVAQYSAQLQQEEGAEAITGAITGKTDEAAGEGTLVLELDEEGMVILDLAAKSEDSEAPTALTLNFIQGEVENIEAPEEATDLADIIPGVTMLVTSLMSLGESEEEPAA